MPGMPCIRVLQVAVGVIVGLLTTEDTKDDVMKLYPHLEPVDTGQTLA
jgi:uncharacterized protein (DUF433 family)